MQSKAATIKDYLHELPEARKEVMLALHTAILKHLPKGFRAEMGYGMIGYVVPHRLYPAGYHCNPELPLPLMGIASQKNHIAVYHMGIYADKKLRNWLLQEYPNHTLRKPDMGKSCLRFKKPDHVPVKLMAELASRLSVEEWIALYEKTLK